MKTLSLITLTATLLAPAAALANPTTAATAANAPAAQTTRSAGTNATSVAMTKHDAAKPTSFGRQATDDREGLARVQEQARQLGANN